MRNSTLILVIFFGAILTSHSQDVDFAVFRVKAPELELIQVSEFSQDFHKALPVVNQTGNISWENMPPSDFGYRKITSQLTSKVIFDATMCWMCNGEAIFPKPNSYHSTITYDINTPEPTNIFLLFEDDAYWTDSNFLEAWELVKNTDIISNLSASYEYEVLVFPMVYGWGGAEPNPEWVIIAYNLPPAPKDMGIADVLWPRIVNTTNEPIQPEILIYNFSNSSDTIKAKATIKHNGESYSSIKEIHSVPQDAYLNVEFDCFVPENSKDYNIEFELLDKNGPPLSDHINENNFVQRYNQSLCSNIVFRKYPSKLEGSHQRRIVDIDKDGDQDIVQWGYGVTENILLNDGELNFSSAGNSELLANRYCRSVEIAELTGDSDLDILFSYYNEPSSLFKGVGEGLFTDITNSAQLDTILSIGFTKTIDLENDGDMDLIFSSKGQETFMLNDGTGKFSIHNSGIIDSNDTQDIAVGDLNNDGFSDIVIANYIPLSSKPAASGIFINDGTGHFVKQKTQIIQRHAREVEINDFDNDGFKDIIISEHSDTPSSIYKNTGKFSSDNFFTPSFSFGKAFNLDVADINGDGYSEILLDSKLYSFNGNDFIDISQSLNGYSTPQQFADVNNDGFIDFFSLVDYFLLNQSSFTCDNLMTIDTIRTANMNTMVGDIKIDGKLDDDAWTDVAAIEIDKVFGTETPTVTAYWKAAWTTQGIFVGIEAVDDVWAPHWVTNSIVYDWVTISLDLSDPQQDGKGGKDAFGNYNYRSHFQELDMGNTASENAWGQEMQDSSMYYYSTNYNGIGNYSCEFYIPAHQLFINGVKTGKLVELVENTVIGFDAYVIDNDNDGNGVHRKAWANTGAIHNGWNNMDDVGLLTLKGNGDPINIEFNLPEQVSTKITSQANTKVFPTHIIDNFTVESVKPMQQVSILKLTGQVLQNKNVSGKQANLTVKNLQTGMYLARVRFADNSYYTQLINVRNDMY